MAQFELRIFEKNNIHQTLYRFKVSLMCAWRMYSSWLCILITLKEFNLAVSTHFFARLGTPHPPDMGHGYPTSSLLDMGPGYPTVRVSH